MDLGEMGQVLLLYPKLYVNKTIAKTYILRLILPQGQKSNKTFILTSSVSR